MISLMSLISWLPNELIIEIATLLDAPSLIHFESTCKALLDLVTRTPALEYILALAMRGLCDGPPSSITPASRLERVKAYDEAWRTFSWSEHLVLELPYPHQAPYVFGNTLVLPIHETRRMIRSFIMQSIPSPLRGASGRQWRIEFDFFVDPFVIDATQDLLVVVPKHDTRNIFLCALSTGQPHPLSAKGGLLYLESSRHPFQGNSKHEISGNFLGMITHSSEVFDDRLFIWNWKTGIIHVKMPIRVGSHHEVVFSFLDDRHFVIPSVPSERPNEIILNVYELHHHRHHGQRVDATPVPVRSYVLPLADPLTDVCSLRFFPDVSARGGASPGHFFADDSKREFGIQIEATSQSTDTVTVHELLVPVRALMATAPKDTPPPCRRVSVCYEPFLGRRLAYASRLAAERHSKVPPEKFPPALRGVGARQLRFAVCCGALLVFEHAKEDLNLPRKLHIFAF